MKSAAAILEAKSIPEPNSGCWLWLGGDRKPYGAVYFSGRSHLAHRLAYETYVGPIPRGLCVRHSCDNPKCVNPQHLDIGTDKDNNDDMMRRGRKVQVRGEYHGMARLVPTEVLAIRQERANGMSWREISRSRKIPIGRARSAILRWRHLDELEAK